MITLTAADSQIVLYAKGHFLRRNEMIDLRVLVGNRAGCEPQDISDGDIVTVLMIIIEELRLKVDSRFIHAIIFGQFGQKKDPVRNFVDAALGLMSVMPVRENSGEVLVDIQPINHSLKLLMAQPGKVAVPD